MNKKISVLNVRIGLACNSSSSHSILILGDKEKNYTTTKSDFHWEFFTAGDKESKSNYLMACLEEGIRKVIPEEQREGFMKKFFKGYKAPEDIYSRDISVDHQSVLTFPMDFKGNLNEEFIRDFQKFLERDDVAILGGNDNTSKEHHLKEEGEVFDLEYPKEDNSLDWVSRKDKNKGFWTLFNRRTGAKIRFSFDGNEIDIKKASSPELVDMKITDYCPYDCEFCYQDSTLKGKHASLDFIKDTAQKLADAEVLECALGGGETTLHPDFIEILKIFHSKGIVANFTTKNMNLLKSVHAEEIAKYTGAIAFSVESANDIEKVQNAYIDLKNKIEEQRGYGTKPLINIQYVMGSTPIDSFLEIIKASAKADFNVTLLGYKENGRGNQFEMYDYKNWLRELKRLNTALIKEGVYSQISVDTALAAQYKDELKDAGVDERTYHTNEGGFSLYIDAVKETMGPSSYIGFEQEVKFSDNWLEDYKTIFIEAPTEKPRARIKIGK